MAEVPWDTALHRQAPRLFWLCGRCWPRLVGSACFPTLLPKGHRARPTLAGACSPVPAFTWSVAELDLAVPPTPSKAPWPLPPPWGCGGLGLTQHWEPGSKVRGQGWVCSDHCRRWSHDLTLQLSGPHQPPWRWASTGRTSSSASPAAGAAAVPQGGHRQGPGHWSRQRHDAAEELLPPRAWAVVIAGPQAVGCVLRGLAGCTAQLGKTPHFLSGGFAHLREGH